MSGLGRYPTDSFRDASSPERSGRYGHFSSRLAFSRKRPFGNVRMPRKTNYDFERREREKSKAAEAAKKAQAKADKKASEHTSPDDSPIKGA